MVIIVIGCTVVAFAFVIAFKLVGPYLDRLMLGAIGAAFAFVISFKIIGPGLDRLVMVALARLYAENRAAHHVQNRWARREAARRGAGRQRT